MRALTIVFTLLAAIALSAQEQDPFTETIYVTRYALDVRVADSQGKAIDDLTLDDFIVTIGGKPAHVEGANWIPQGHRIKVPDAPIEGDIDTLPTEPDVRSVVILIQTDFGRFSARVLGQMKFNYLAKDILTMFGPYDRVAVLSHDSHLKFRHDFTSDRDAVRKAIEESIAINKPPPPAPATVGQSLSPFLDRDEMKRINHAEEALLFIAKALEQLEGEKLIILAGWGIGDLRGRAGVKLRNEWNDAMAILHREHIPVVTLGTGVVGGQLTYGLKATADATGGFYAGTQDFESHALTRLEAVLAGHYALTLRVEDDLEPGQYPLEVRITRKDAIAHAPPYIVHQ
ncbi:MAG TPA: hypothetical protein VGQ76_19500 [Thermoanaerobaculia bacterium]|jgi:hypothetical protein|nr:hypothetical protein [Thermoanaerobaculia bacterium]